MAVSKTLLSPRPFSATGRQKAARAYPEPMETEEWEKFADGRVAIAHAGAKRRCARRLSASVVAAAEHVARRRRGVEASGRKARQKA